MDHEVLVEIKATGEQKYIDLDDFDPKLHDRVEDGDEPDLDPVWADSDALASAGWGTDEDYGG